MIEIKDSFFIILNVLPILLIQVIVTTLIVLTYKKKNSLSDKIIKNIICVNYLVALVGVNVFPIIITNQNIALNNFIIAPFSNFSYSLIHLIGVAIMFIPVGIYAKTLKNALAYSLILGVGIEALKFLGRYKIPDITYILFYVLGATLGFVIYKFAKTKIKNRLQTQA